MKPKQKSRLLAAGFVLVCLLAALIAKAEVHPSGGTLQHPWQPGGTIHVTWTPVDVRATTQILLFNADNGQLLELANGVEGSRGSYDVRLPLHLAQGEHYRLAIREEGQHGRTMFATGYHIVSPLIARTPTTVPSLGPFEPSMAVGPNPTSSIAHLTWTDTRTRVIIRRVTGEEIFVQDLREDRRALDLDVHQYGPGVYTIELTGGPSAMLRTLLIIQ